MLVADLRTPIHDLLAEFESWLGDVTVLEWVLIGIALGALLWVIAAVRAATHLGPIEIDAIECGSSGGDLVGQTSLLRERIAKVGLRPPPWVPVGAPAADLLSAISTSPVPQANWIAALIQVMPRPQPVSYKLTTTLLPAEKSVRIWLRPSGAGSALLKTVPGGIDAALERIPELIFVHINKDAVGVFPGWARWNTRTALWAYLKGLRATERKKYDEALHAFTAASSVERGNALVRLRALNIRELVVAEKAERERAAALSATEGLAAQGSDDQTALPDETAQAAETAAESRARVLRDYLDLATRRPELVEAHYRTSTLASTLADTFRDLESPAARQRVHAALDWQDTPVDKLDSALRDLGERELDQALFLLEPWSVPLVWHRPRYSVEPRGYARRRVKRTLEISKRCQLARKLRSSTKSRDRLRLWMAENFVRFNAARTTADWQADYNAGCFFALRNKRDQAYRYLKRAVDETPDGRLLEWLVHGDPDLSGLRDRKEPEWNRLIQQRDRTLAWPKPLTKELRSTVFMFASSVALIATVILVPWAWAAALALVIAPQGWRMFRHLTRRQ
jgi:hypothetical protein